MSLSKNSAAGGRLVALAVIALASMAQAGCVSGPTGAATLEELQSRKPASRSHARSPRFSPAPLRPGQWVRYLVNGGSESPMAYTLKVLERGDLPFSFWLEEVVETPTAKLVARSQVIMDESRVAVAGSDPNFEPVITDFGRNVRILRGDGGSVQEVPRGSLSPGLPLLGSRVAFFGGAEVGKPRKVTVRAGEFKGCYEASGTLSLAGKEGPLSGCLDAQVPLHGVVEARDPAGRRWELVDFGFSGALSDLP